MKIKIQFIIIFLHFMSICFADEIPKEVIAVKNGISSEMLISHIEFLASKYCRGREPGDVGMKIAQQYITSTLKGAQIKPAGKYSDYYQYLKLMAVSLDNESYLRIETSIGSTPIVHETKLEFDYLPISLSAEREVAAPVVFVGYGISAPEHSYDDYKGIDTKGKIVLLLRHEPGEKDENSPFDGRRNSKHGTLLNKILNAQDHGAVGVLFVTDPLNHTEFEPDNCSGTYWANLREKHYEEDEDYKYMQFSPMVKIIGDNYGVQIPAVSIHLDVAESIIGEDKSLLDIQKRIDSGLKQRSFQIPNKNISFRVAFDTEKVDARNIVGIVKGSDPNMDEVVIVGAHYDHVGKNKRGQVHGGADDNASGTAGVLELARAFQKLESKPKRSIVFILFTGEEKGLFGSKYYVENPLYPLEKTTAFVNLDMIGRNDIDQICVLGKYQFPKLFNIVENMNKKSTNFDITFSIDDFVSRSDQMPFLRHNVPFVFFNSGLHDQYHRPEDTVDRIIPGKVLKVIQLTFLSLWQIADLPPNTILHGGNNE